MVVHRISNRWQEAFRIVVTAALPRGALQARRRSFPRLRGVWYCDPRNACTLPESRALIHAIAHVQHELGCRSRNAFTMRDVIEGPAQLRVLGNEFPDLLHSLASGFQTLLEFGLGLYSGLAQSHLYATVSVDLTFARSFDGQENHFFEFVDDGGLYAVRLRRRHAAERFERQHHVAKAVHGVVNVFADFEVTFPAASELVIERMGHLSQVCLRDEVVSDAAHVLDRPVIEEIPHTLAGANAP